MESTMFRLVYVQYSDYTKSFKLPFNNLPLLQTHNKQTYCTVLVRQSTGLEQHKLTPQRVTIFQNNTHCQKTLMHTKQRRAIQLMHSVQSVTASS